MGKPISTIGPNSGTGTARGGMVLVLLVVAVIVAIKLFTNGVSPAVGLPLAIGGAFVIDRALFGRWK